MSRLAILLFPLLSIFVGLIAAEHPVESFRQTVGPAIMMAADTNPAVRESTGRLIVVSWNIHVGNGDVVALIDRISSFEHAQGNGNPAIVLLLQESVRQSSDIPESSGFSVPGRIARAEDKLDIAALARKLGWWMYYAPSMRNGDGAGDLAEDRGNAILSSLPLQSVEPVELPFSVQRRVALVATVADTSMQPLLRVAVTHFDTRAPLTKGWIFGGPRVRNKQASGLLASLHQYETDGLPLIVGGDLNSYLGSKGVIETMSAAAPHMNCGDKPTHTMGLTLDHMFANVPDAWPHTCRREDDSFGSDHYPLVLSVTIPR